MVGRGDPPIHQILGHGQEVVERALAVLFLGRLPPGGTELPAAADVGDRERPSPLEPRLPADRAVERRHRGLETAVAVQQGRIPAGFGLALPLDEEVRHARPVPRGRLELTDDDALRVEHGRQAPHFAHSARLPHVKGRRLVPGSEREEPALRERIGGDHVDRSHVRRRHRLGEPAVAFVAVAQQSADHVVEDLDEELPADDPDALNSGARPGLDHEVECAVSLEEPLVLDGHDGSLRELPAADFPRRAEIDHEVASGQVGDRVEREIERVQRTVVVEDVGPRLEEGRCMIDERETLIGRVDGTGPYADVRGLPFEKDLGIRERRPTAPELRDPGVAGLGQSSGPEIRGNEKRVGAAPGDAALGLGQEEAPRDEGACLDVELAGLDRVRAAAGQTHQAEPILRRQALGSVEGPLHAFLSGQAVDVEDRFPDRVVPDVGLPARPPPDPALVIGVLPEVVDPVSQDRRIGELVLGVQDREALAEDRIVYRAAAEAVEGGGVLPLDPGQGSLAFDLLEPEEGIRRLLRPGDAGEDQAQDEAESPL